MKKQILHITPVQTAKVFAVLYFLISIPMAIFMGISFSFAPADERPPLGFVIAIPFFYAIGGFLFTAFGAWVYNLTTRYVGGIEYTSTENG